MSTTPSTASPRKRKLIRGVLSANKRLKLNSATNDKDNVFSDDASADLYERELEQIHTTLARSHDQVALTNISKHVCKIIETQARSCEADNDLEEWLNKMSQKDNFKPDKFEGYDQLVQDIYKSYETTYSVPRLVRERYVYLKEPYTKDELQERMNEQLYSVLRLYIHKRRLKQQDQSKRLGACLSSDQHRDGRRNATVAIIKKIVPIFIDTLLPLYKDPDGTQEEVPGFQGIREYLDRIVLQKDPGGSHIGKCEMIVARDILDNYIDSTWKKVEETINDKRGLANTSLKLISEGVLAYNDKFEVVVATRPS